MKWVLLKFNPNPKTISLRPEKGKASLTVPQKKRLGLAYQRKRNLPKYTQITIEAKPQWLLLLGRLPRNLCQQRQSIEWSVTAHDSICT